MAVTRSVIRFVVATDVAVNLAAIVHGLLRTENPSRYFGEGRWVMFVSCLQLLLTAFFAGRLFGARGRIPAPGRWVWLLVALGFVFLTADEALQIHENLDKWIHHFFHLEQTALTDRIDDAMIVAYGLIGLGVLWFYRGELRQFPVLLRPLGAGFVCLFISAACDTLSNRPDVFLWLTGGNLALAKKMDGWFSVGDGAFTILAEGLFAAAFFLAWRQAEMASGKTGAAS